MAISCAAGSARASASGRAIASQTGARLLRLTSETRTRNDPALILQDAILDDTHLDRLFAAIYDTTGQICMNAKRVYVHRSRLDEVVRGLSARLQKVKLGYGLDADTTMGPLHSPAQKTFVEELIREAKDAGADVREYGELPGGDMQGGNFVRPAIVINPDPTLRIVTEEQFGPALPVIAYDSLDGAVERANGAWRYEFYACYDLPYQLADLNRLIDSFAHLYNHYRPHGALRGLTPAAYLHSLTPHETSLSHSP